MLLDALKAGKATTNANKVNRIDLDVRLFTPTSNLVFIPIFQVMGRNSVASARLTGHGRVAATLFLSEEFEKQNDGFTFGFEMVAHRLARRSDTSPTPHQASLSEQIGLDGHRVEAGHVFRDVCPLNVKAIGLVDHVGMIMFSRFAVQREF